MITALYAGILGLFFFVLSMKTIKARWKHKVSLGYGPNNEIIEIVSAHSNFANYTVFFLVLLFLAEASAAIPVWILHIPALAFTTGRLLHCVAFVAPQMDFKKRKLGMQMTFFPMIFTSVLCIYSFIKVQFL